MRPQFAPRKQKAPTSRQHLINRHPPIIIMPTSPLESALGLPKPCLSAALSTPRPMYEDDPLLLSPEAPAPTAEEQEQQEQREQQEANFASLQAQLQARMDTDDERREQQLPAPSRPSVAWRPHISPEMDMKAKEKMRKALEETKAKGSDENTGPNPVAVKAEPRQKPANPWAPTTPAALNYLEEWAPTATEQPTLGEEEPAEEESPGLHVVGCTSVAGAVVEVAAAETTGADEEATVVVEVMVHEGAATESLPPRAEEEEVDKEEGLRRHSSRKLSSAIELAFDDNEAAVDKEEDVEQPVQAAIVDLQQWQQEALQARAASSLLALTWRAELSCHAELFQAAGEKFAAVLLPLAARAPAALAASQLPEVVGAWLLTVGVLGTVFGADLVGF